MVLGEEGSVEALQIVSNTKNITVPPKVKNNHTKKNNSSDKPNPAKIKIAKIKLTIAEVMADKTRSKRCLLMLLRFAPKTSSFFLS
jgi:hypothetical protein